MRWILPFLFGLGIAMSPSLADDAKWPSATSAIVIRAIDGDTFEADVATNLNTWKRIRVRLLGIDAPEMDDPCARRKAWQAHLLLATLLYRYDGSLALYGVKPDKYPGRIDAGAIIGRSGDQATFEDVAETMLKSGFVRPYDGGKRLGWCD